MYYTYMIRCKDNSIYTGITTDLDRRFEEHSKKTNKCAKYTLNHQAEKIECAWESENRVLASKLEFHIKKLTKLEKEQLIKDNKNLKKLLSEKIDYKNYKRIKFSKNNYAKEKGMKVSNLKDNMKGITLVALIVTIIVLLILAGASITLISGNNGIINQSTQAKEKLNNSKYKEQIEMKVTEVNINNASNNLTDTEKFETIRDNLQIENAECTIKSKYMYIDISENEKYTILADGTILNGKHAYIDVSEGTVEIKANGYVQGGIFYKNSAYRITEEEKDNDLGTYIITGTTTENVVRIVEKGSYKITIRDLNIDVSAKNNLCAFNANNKKIATDLNVELIIEGNNVLKGGSSAPGLGFAGATPNVDGVTNGSVLTISGKGSLICEGGSFGSGIGSGYTGFDAAAGPSNNIIINSGNIEAKGGNHGSGIGAPLYKDANNIIINGGNLNLYGNYYGAGIGSTETAKNIIINGGNINITSTFGNGIGADTIENIIINGGEISINKSSNINKYIACIGGDGNIIINGGTINCNTIKSGVYGLSSGTGTISINGGNIKLNTVEGYKTNVIPLSQEQEVYLTKLKIPNISEKTKITDIIINEDVGYIVKDIYTDVVSIENESCGYIYVYLPLGSREIKVNLGENCYSGVVETTVDGSEIILNLEE